MTCCGRVSALAALPCPVCHHRQTDTMFAFIYRIEFLPFGPPIWVKGGQQFAKAYEIKVRCYGEYVGEYIGNLGNILGTH